MREKTEQEIRAYVRDLGLRCGNENELNNI